MKMSIGYKSDGKILEMPSDVERLFRIAFPAYKGRKFKIMTQESVFMADTYWDGGSRSEYVVIRLIDQVKLDVPDLISGGFLPTAKAAMEALRSFQLPDGLTVIRHSIFCGKDTGLTMYVRPDNMGKFLPA